MIDEKDFSDISDEPLDEPPNSEEKSQISKKSDKSLGKIGIIIMTIGMFFLFYDSYVINQMFPTNYHFYQHPEIHIPITAMLLAFSGTAIFIIHFKKGRNVF